MFTFRGRLPGFAGGISGSTMSHSTSVKSLGYAFLFIPVVYHGIRLLKHALNLHSLTVRRLAREGQIPAFKIGRQWRFQKDQIDALFAGGKAPDLSE